MSHLKDIHTEFYRMLSRSDKEVSLRQRGRVFWLYGLSGSGKSTLLNILMGLIYLLTLLEIINLPILAWDKYSVLQFASNQNEAYLSIK